MILSAVLIGILSYVLGRLHNIRKEYGRGWCDGWDECERLWDIQDELEKREYEEVWSHDREEYTPSARNQTEYGKCTGVNFMNTKFQVLENNKPCDSASFQQLRGCGWDNSFFNSFADAVEGSDFAGYDFLQKLAVGHGPTLSGEESE